MNPAFVRFQNIQKTYDGSKLIVRQLNLDIAEGEFLTLLGPSGSGKTTSLMMLAGFEAPSQGEIFLQGQPLHRLPAHKRNIGMVFQNYALFPHMTVEENLAFPLSVRRVPRRQRREKVMRALEMVKLQELAKRYPAQMSGGQQQRVALARALVFEPSLVLMDEPLGALDKQLREHMQLEIKQLHRQLGLTVIYVTHDQSEALTMSDRVAVFNDGVIQQISPPAVIYEQPDTPFVASFIGENNALSAHFESGQGQQACVLIQGVRMPAHALATCSPGQALQVFVRPERLRVASGDEPAIQARIEDHIYLGDQVRMMMRLPQGEALMMKLPAGRMQSDWAPGQTLALSWSGEHARAMPLQVAA